MLIFISLILTIFGYCGFKILKKIRKQDSFNKVMNKSDFDTMVTKSDLISFRHEFGETIFEIQREIEEIKRAIDKAHE